MQARLFPSAKETKLLGRFERLRSQLHGPKYADRLDKPIAFWALLSDRRLPHAFLNRSLRELIDTPFGELCATAGVGQKKIMSLITLLSRATQDTPPTPSAGEWDEDSNTQVAEREVSPLENGVFNPAVVSEALWSRWKDTVQEHSLGQQPFGRLAPSLVHLPSALWNMPLDEYSDRTLDEIRHLKTHGEKRVNAVLEVFYTVHEALAHGSAHSHFEVRLAPKFVGPIENWIADVRSRKTTPSTSDVRESLIRPLVDQLEIDAGPVIYELAAGRVGVNGPPQTVRNQAKRLGVTRARVYQLLEECGRVMAVRWSEGEALLRQLLAHLHSVRAEAEAIRLLSVVLDLYYPRTHGDSPQVETDQAVVGSPVMAH